MKTFRVYFNRDKDWPMVWCVDEGSIDTQIRCCCVYTTEAIAHTWHTVLGPNKTDGKVAPNEPIAWVEVVGVLRVDSGVVFIERVK